jgi:peptide deformylase
MILPVFAFGQPVLKKKSTDITKDYEGYQSLISNMWETMYAAHGVGIAAPQIGVSVRLICY